MQIYIPNSPFSLKPRPEIKGGCAIRRVILPIWNEPERRRSPGAAVQEPMHAQQKKIKEEIRLPAAAREPQNIARAKLSIYKASTLQILFFNRAGVQPAKRYI